MPTRSAARHPVVVPVAALLAALLAALVWWFSGDAGPTGTVEDPLDRAPTASSAASSPTAADPTTDPASGLPVVRVADLPPEAVRTLALIAAGGPYPYDRDGVTFENREGLLPDEPRGYYREYTVPTPGSSDRGARRIVAGAAEERYWTADHYDSFALIAPNG